MLLSRIHHKQKFAITAIVLLLALAIGMGFVSRHYDAYRLITAIRNDDEGKVYELLEAGINPNIPDCPEFYAAFCESSSAYPIIEVLADYDSNDVQLVRKMLEKGLNPSLECNGLLPVFRAVQMQPNTNGENNSEDIAEIVQLLLKNESINVTTSSGKSLLMFAAESGNLSMVEWLLEEGCSPLLMDDADRTALDYAVYSGNTEMVRQLKDIPGMPSTKR